MVFSLTQLPMWLLRPHHAPSCRSHGAGWPAVAPGRWGGAHNTQAMPLWPGGQNPAALHAAPAGGTRTVGAPAVRAAAPYGSAHRWDHPATDGLPQPYGRESDACDRCEDGAPPRYESQ